ncbi:hypothetical protein SPRG_11720 [Saprolegnia parasitica CBS 223.65]|uniref:Uncharacterized protein n=1 Tax=Saprolegnia parasitica (strain CBS 223.65) TaxID=695850 RepID=A0A067BW78_SAPPC|nr:hypothetical protein SPRG_11720 [Saprolegnia parasitica CBS 223.65]KDO22538.1 hypothetical protein SPRG_11720 [Saprolegnia parasitica CBS 223.65]|eukprot:XP_012206784.1 hypothetical protein SPRG_11720 [Saprolegnia parasitica CBS 223.65]
MSNYGKWDKILRELEEDEAETSTSAKTTTATTGAPAKPRLSHKPHQLREDMREASERIHALEKDLKEYDALASVLDDLPKKLEHEIMVPLGKQAFIPGSIIHSNEIIAHLGGDHYAKKTAIETQDMIARRQKNITGQIDAQKEWLASLHDKLHDVDHVLKLKKIYEEENIQEIKQSEEESDALLQATDATNEDFEEYFEIENEEVAKAQAADAWNWDEAMQRMEELEKHETGISPTSSIQTPSLSTPTSPKPRASSSKATQRSPRPTTNYQSAMEYYSKALALQPSSHTLLGNRSAAYFHLRKFDVALEDATKAVSIDASWPKGHFRRGQALGELGRFDEAAAAFEKALALKPTDKSSAAQAATMRAKAKAKEDAENLRVSNNSSVFSGRVLERGTVPAAVAAPETTPMAAPKRVSRFKAMRQGQSFE